METVFSCDIFENKNYEDKAGEQKLKLFAIESYAKEIDDHLDKELFRRLILDHASVARKLERTAKSLLKSEAKLKEAQKIALLGYWDVDHKSHKRTWSESFHDILEIDLAEEPSLELLFSRIHPEDRNVVEELIQKMISEKEAISVRFRLLVSAGAIKWINLNFITDISPEGEALFSRGTIQDITRIKTVEDKLEEYNCQLEAMVDEKVREISESQMATIFALVKLSESRDDETGQHIERTASFCKLLASKAKQHPNYSDKIDEKFIETIYKASPLHDIGKVGIPDAILLKPGRLTDEEFAVMKQHVMIGYRTLADIGKLYEKNEFLKMGMEITKNHHEKWNGSGYLSGISGEDIPVSARIMALADVYDALRSKRVYKEAYSHEKSRDIIISSKGTHFDPVLVDLFVESEKDFEQLHFDLT